HRKAGDRQSGAIIELGSRFDRLARDLFGAEAGVLVRGVHRAQRVIAATAVGVEPGELLHRAMRRDAEYAMSIGDQAVDAGRLERILLVFFRQQEVAFLQYTVQSIPGAEDAR